MSPPTPLARLRYEKCLSQEDLARMSGITRVTISRLERELVKPRPSTRRALAKALGVDALKLWPLNDNGAPQAGAEVTAVQPEPPTAMEEVCDDEA